MNIYDNFIDSYQELKDYALTANFKYIENPVDGVSYPLICDEIPESIKSEILNKIELNTGIKPSKITIFMRRSPDGVPVPHIAHTDNSMGKFSFMLYLFERENAGTGFIRHLSTGIMYAPESHDFLSIVKADQNNTNKWAIVDMAKAKENRAVIFDAGKFHCAMPIGGFGEGAEARTVLTVFFS